MRKNKTKKEMELDPCQMLLQSVLALPGMVFSHDQAQADVADAQMPPPHTSHTHMGLSLNGSANECLRLIPL